jgi:flagellar biosynthetic protein FliQ
MTAEFVLGLGREAITLVLFVAAPMLGFGLLVGLTVSIFQAVTQVHEMTLTFIPKIVAVAFALMIFLPWMISIITDFTTRLFEMIPTIVA